MGLEHRSSTGLRETDSTLGGCTQGLRCTETAKALTSGKPGPDLPAGLGESSGRAGWLWLTVGTMTLAVEVLGDDHQLEFSRRLQGWDNLGHTTNKTGTQPHPAADSLPKDSLR